MLIPSYINHQLLFSSPVSPQVTEASYSHLPLLGGTSWLWAALPHQLRVEDFWRVERESMGPLFEAILLPGLIHSEPVMEMAVPQIAELPSQVILLSSWRITPGVCGHG